MERMMKAAHPKTSYMSAELAQWKPIHNQEPTRGDATDPPRADKEAGTNQAFPIHRAISTSQPHSRA